MSWFKKWFNKPLHFPRLLTIDFFKNATILNTNTPLYKDYEKAYKEYLIKYNSYKREKKINEILK